MPPQTVRERIFQALEDLPPDATFDDAIERLVFLAKIDAGLAELDEGDADLPEASVVNVSQIIAVNKTRLVEWIGALSQDKMRRVMGGIRQVLEGEDLGL